MNPDAITLEVWWNRLVTPVPVFKSPSDTQPGEISRKTGIA